MQGDLVGIAKLNIKANTLGALALTGVFAIPQVRISGDFTPAGTKLYWDATQGVATKNDNSGENKYLGKSILDADGNDETVQVRLCP